MKRIYLLLPFLLAAAAPAQDTNCVTRSDLADYALLSDLSPYALRSDLDLFVTRASLADYALLSDLAAYAPLSALAGYVTSADLSAYALLSDLAAYATSSDLADYVTTADLTNYPTASDLAAACNARLPAQAHVSGSNTTWHVAQKTAFKDKLFASDDFEVTGEALFNGQAAFDGDAIFSGGLTLGGESRTNFPGPRSLTVEDGGAAWVDDGLVWTGPDESDVSIYLANLALVTNAADRAHTVVVREIDTDETSCVTKIYDGTSDPAVLVHTLTSTNPTAVFDWCQSATGWYLR